MYLIFNLFFSFMKGMQFIVNMILFMEPTGKKKMGKFQDKASSHAKEKALSITLCGTCLLNVLLEV